MLTKLTRSLLNVTYGKEGKPLKETELWVWGVKVLFPKVFNSQKADVNGSFNLLMRGPGGWTASSRGGWELGIYSHVKENVTIRLLD